MSHCTPKQLRKKGHMMPLVKKNRSMMTRQRMRAVARFKEVLYGPATNLNNRGRIAGRAKLRRTCWGILRKEYPNDDRRELRAQLHECETTTLMEMVLSN